MKKGVIISLICLMLLCSMAEYTFATTGIVKVDDLRLRESNSTSSEIITLMSIGEKVEILSKTENGWYKVKYKEYEGYVSGDFIEAKEEVIETEKVEEPKEPEETKTPEQETKTPEQETKTPEQETQTQVIEEPIANEEQTQPSQEKTIIKTVSKGEKLYGIPLINANAITVIDNDLEVNVLAEVNNWSYISSEVFEGWVRTEKLIDKNSDDTNNDKTVVHEKIGYISGNEVNFRRGPTTNAEIISVLTLNRELIVLENTNGWVKAKVGNEEGYVSATYVSDKKIEKTSRNATSRKTNNSTVENKKTETIQNVPENPKGIDIVSYAKQYLGYKYVYGGNTPAGFDCSGFTQYVFKQFGYSLNRTANNQSSNGVSISKANMQPGDLICFSNSKGSTSIGHVGIYIGNGQFIHAANSRKGVIISNVDGAGFYYVCSRRII